MELHDYLASLTRDARRSFFDALDRHPVYIQSIAAKKRQASPTLAKDIEVASAGQVKRFELRKDIFDFDPRAVVPAPKADKAGKRKLNGKSKPNGKSKLPAVKSAIKKRKAPRVK